MNRHLRSHTSKLLFIIWGVLIALVSPVSLYADSYDDFVGFIEKVEDSSQGTFKLENSPLGISTEELREYKSIVECFESANNDVDVAICTDKFNETEAGQQVAGELGVPSYVDDIIDAYIMYRTHDWWGLAKKLGGIAVCIILHVVTTVDACGILEALLDTAQALWDAASAVWNWAEDFGGEVWNAISGAYCDYIGWGCDDEPDTPDFVFVYNMAFHPRVSEGVTAREAVDSTQFYSLTDSIKKDALHKPLPIIPGTPDTILKLLASAFHTQSVDQASQVYTNNVDIQWSNDIVNRVVPERRDRMDTYTNPVNFNFMTLVMMQDYEQSPNAWNASRKVVERCTDQFRNEFRYIHIDRWKTTKINDANAESLKKEVPHNHELCQQFFNINKNEFSKRVRSYIVSKEYCKEFGADLGCASVENYQHCRKLLTPFAAEESCKLTLKAANAVKHEIIAEFKKKGSRYYGAQAPASQGMHLTTANAHNFTQSTSNAYSVDMILTQPLEFTCYRPSHAYYFDHFYEKYANLPQQSLQKKMQIDADYLALTEKVKEAVDKINAKYANQAVFVGLPDPQRDPLVVGTASVQDLDILKEDDEDYGFGGFTVESYMAFPSAIDGQERPIIFHDMASKVKDTLKKDRLKVNPNVIDGKIDPITKPGFNQNIKASVTTPQSMQVFKQQGIKNAALPQTAPTQPMSGTLPPGQQPKSAPTPFAKVDTNVQGSMKAETVRIEGGKNLKIAGKTAYWGRSMTLNAKDALSQANGTCRFNLEYTLQNRGKANSGMFYSRWENRSLKGRANERRMSSLAAGGAQKVTETIDLVPGKNSVVLTLNSRGKGGEQQRYELTINLSGTCAVRSNMAIPQRNVITPEPASKSVERSTTVKPAETPQKEERTVKNPVFAPVR